MKREDIEKAAIDNIEFQGNLDLGTIIENACRECFVSGANWRINSVWHEPSEKPKKNDVHIAVYNKWGIKTDFWRDFGGWEKYVRLDKVIKWAYIEDLIPNTED